LIFFCFLRVNAGRNFHTVASARISQGVPAFCQQFEPPFESEHLSLKSIFYNRKRQNTNAPGFPVLACLSQTPLEKHSTFTPPLPTEIYTDITCKTLHLHEVRYAYCSKYIGLILRFLSFINKTETFGRNSNIEWLFENIN